MNFTATKFLAINAFAALMASLFGASTTFAADRIRVGLSSFTPINAALWIAEDKGLFKKYAIESEVVLIGGASAGAGRSLVARDVPFLRGRGRGGVSPGPL